MVEFIFRVGSEEADLLETSIVFFSFANLLQWCFFIMITILKMVKIHKKIENAPQSKKKTFSKNTKGKRR